MSLKIKERQDALKDLRVIKSFVETLFFVILFIKSCFGDATCKIIITKNIKNVKEEIVKYNKCIACAYEDWGTQRI